MIFQQLHTHNESPGTGTGFAIGKRVVERQGGSIGMESESGSGFTVSFTLPMS